MKNRIILLSTLVLIVSSCKLNNNIIGKYASQKSANAFQFRSDSTFFYEHKVFHIYQYSEGIWKEKSKGLAILKSDIKTTTIPLIVRSHRDRKNNSNEIKIALNIQGGGSLADYNCAIYLNDILYATKRCDSINLITLDVPVNNIYFRLIKQPLISFTNVVAQPLFTTRYMFKASKGNEVDIDINLKESLFFYKSFNGDTVKIRNKAIKIFDHYHKKWEKIPKVQNNSNIFSHFYDTLK
jgi:hypothetical protein